MNTIGEQIRIAIVRECSAPKLGNVYPGVDFADMSYETFCEAAAAIGREVDKLLRSQGHQTNRLDVGDYCLCMVQGMMDAVGKNTSLGTILLLAPLVAAKEKSEQLDQVLQSMSRRDASLVYESIRLANPGGMGQTTEMDVAQAAPPSLTEAMQFASRYDDVALQYVSDFALVKSLAYRIASLVSKPHGMRTNSTPHASLTSSSTPQEVTFDHAIQRIQLELLAERIDSLIARKSGIEKAIEIRNRCLELIQHDPAHADWHERWAALDRWMRAMKSSHGKQLANPGTTADLIAAAIFFCLQNQLCKVPSPAHRPLLPPS